MDRLYIIDKPVGMTSFFALKILKKKLDFPKLGHAGTLDPLASGLLLVATGNYTKLLPYIENTSKEYIFTLALDGNSPSYDLGTEVQKIDASEVLKYSKTLNKKILQGLLEKHFLGEIEQIPPKYSAIKIDGKLAVRRVLSGEDITIKARKSTIYEIEILGFTYPFLELRAKVSSGTYVRSIAHDLGKIVGSGAYVTSLRRTKIGNIEISQAQGVDDFDAVKELDSSYILPKDVYISLNEDEKKKLLLGIPIPTSLSLIPNTEYFVKDGRKIEFITFFDGTFIRPQRKI